MVPGRDNEETIGGFPLIITVYNLAELCGGVDYIVNSLSLLLLLLLLSSSLVLLLSLLLLCIIIIIVMFSPFLKTFFHFLKSLRYTLLNTSDLLNIIFIFDRLHQYQLYIYNIYIC